MPVNPGRLKERITVLSGAVRNTPGGAVTDWEYQTRVWAAVAQVGAAGAGKYQQAGYTDITHELTLRAGTTLTLGRTLVKWRGLTLQPATPPRAADHSGRFVTIACREVNDGEDTGTC